MSTGADMGAGEGAGAGAEMNPGGVVSAPQAPAAQATVAPATAAQVTATPAALALIGELRAEHGEILFHQSGGCCDGSSPMCYPRAEFLVGESDVLLGEIGGVPFYIGRAQFGYWKHTQLIIDVVAGRGGMFSLENGRGARFLTRSRVFGETELCALRADGRLAGG
jgi:uncharacterized protein (DUF779 family)